MRRSPELRVPVKLSKSRSHNALARARQARRAAAWNHRARGGRRDECLPFVPPEDWHEPGEPRAGYRIVVQPAGPGYRHVLTPQQVRDRLAQLPKQFTAPLQLIQFSGMTRKKQSLPCYGLQWGTTVYLYPLEENRVEYYTRPPLPAQCVEARMYGARWEQESRGVWKLVWSEEALQDFYLNNILIHELGHLLDNRNTRPLERERFAEWFAVKYGYQPTQTQRQRRLK
jgi:hypothetical protein